MAQQTIVGIDLGSAVTRTVVLSSQKGEQPEVVASSFVPTKGVRHGYIINIPAAADSIRKSVEIAERESGQKIKRAIFSIGGISISSETAIGAAIVSKSDGEVTAFDIKSTLTSAEESLGLKNRRVVFNAPIAWKIDGKEIMGKPEGVKGVKLEVKMFFITCLTQHLDDLLSAAAEAGIEIIDIIPSPIAASIVALSEKQKIVGVSLVNIGAETVSAAVFENNAPVGLSVFQIGSTDITNDIALGFRISLEEAEGIKIGNIISNNYPKRKVDEIIEARLSDIFELIDGYFKKIKRSGLLPAGVILTGGGSGNSLVEGLAKNMLRLPSRIGTNDVLGNIKGAPRDASWFVAYGLAMMGLNDDGDIRRKIIGGTKGEGIVKKFLKQFLP